MPVVAAACPQQSAPGTGFAAADTASLAALMDGHRASAPAGVDRRKHANRAKSILGQVGVGVLRSAAAGCSVPQLIRSPELDEVLDGPPEPGVEVAKLGALLMSR